MAGLIWLTPAVDDLVEITKKAELKSEKYAQRLAKQLFNKPNILKAMPEMGRRVIRKKAPREVSWGAF